VVVVFVVMCDRIKPVLFCRIEFLLDGPFLYCQSAGSAKFFVS